MIIKRVFNNNVAMITSDNGAELIVIGKGLCFGRHAGDVVEASSVEKTYALCESTANDARAFDRLSSLLESIPVINLAISEDIVEMLREELDVNIDDAILIALADHITLALDRERKGIPRENPLLIEIQQFYRKEYGLAGHALQIIKDYLGIQMSDEERAFITLHIVNATMPQRADRLIVSVQLVRDVLAIVSDCYATTLDDTSLPYERFVRHLQFFARRALDGLENCSVVASSTKGYVDDPVERDVIRELVRLTVGTLIVRRMLLSRLRKTRLRRSILLSMTGKSSSPLWVSLSHRPLSMKVFRWSRERSSRLASR